MPWLAATNHSSAPRRCRLSRHQNLLAKASPLLVFRVDLALLVLVLLPRLGRLVLLVLLLPRLPRLVRKWVHHWSKPVAAVPQLSYPSFVIFPKKHTVAHVLTRECARHRGRLGKRAPRQT